MDFQEENWGWEGQGPTLQVSEGQNCILQTQSLAPGTRRPGDHMAEGRTDMIARGRCSVWMGI